MNIKEALLQEHSKSQTYKIANYIGTDKDKVKQLMALLLGKEQVVNQRAAWVVKTVFEMHPVLILPFLKPMLNNMHNPVHDAVKRHTVRMLQQIDIPPELQGEVCEICFPLVQSYDTAIAIKVAAMTVLKNICKQQPELKNELKLIIENQLPQASAAFISRAKKVVKQLEKL